MTNVRIATGAGQPINRTGQTADYAGDEAELVGVTNDGGETKVVKADADSGTAQPAVGVLFGPVEDLSTYSDELGGLARDMAKTERTTLGNRVTFTRYGILVENTDADWGFTENEPVYLGVGGGYTQTEPSSTGDVQQVVGVAVEPEVVFLEVDAVYDTSA
jgi:hypothetical protein